jgi:hypothetical protein
MLVKLLRVYIDAVFSLENYRVPNAETKMRRAHFCTNTYLVLSSWEIQAGSRVHILSLHTKIYF